MQQDSVDLQEGLEEYLCVSSQGPAISRTGISGTVDFQFSLIITHESKFYKLAFFGKFLLNLYNTLYDSDFHNLI